MGGGGGSVRRLEPVYFPGLRADVGVEVAEEVRFFDFFLPALVIASTMVEFYPFSLPPFYISIIRCLGVLEGLAIQVDPKARIISEAYPYIANRVLTDDTQEELREALRRLIFTTDGHIRWSRLESLLDEAKESSGFDVALALDKLVDYGEFI